MKRDKTTMPKHGIYFELNGYYFWQIWDNGVIVAQSQYYHGTIELAEKELRALNQILNPSTVKNKAITDALEEFKKKNSKP